ncbi:MAG: fatty acid desaturase [Hyphomicrobiales bacterium]|nr:fatty acid desaturase [Hyphomicrobiales bacterium]
MKIYILIGYLIILLYATACAFFAPSNIGPLAGLAIGAGYFIFFWFLAGVYLADVLHLGIAHRSLDFRPWFVKAVTLANNIFGIYVGPVEWVNRHRLHHKYSDREGDPNKLDQDGFWRTLYLCMFPYACTENLARDEILQSRTFRLCSSNLFMAATQVFNFSLLWFIVGDAKFAAAMWIGMRIFALWVNMVQNYWTHTREFGYRRYDDETDNAMNIGEWFPVTATFSACLQNNHHHYPNLLRLSHSESEYDFGFLTIRAMKSLGLVAATKKGTVLPRDVPLSSLGF